MLARKNFMEKERVWRIERREGNGSPQRVGKGRLFLKPPSVPTAARDRLLAASSKVVPHPPLPRACKSLEAREQFAEVA